jgi:CRP-like cAMP-binding protein
MVCSDVTLDDLTDFNAGIEDFSYGHEVQIFSSGKPTTAVYGIRSGALKMIRTDPAAGGCIVRILKTGDVAGLESAFIDHYEHTAITVGEVTACRIPIEHFRNFVVTHPKLQVRLYEKSHAALRETETWLAQLVGGAATARTRIARLLLRLQVDEADRMLRLSLEEMAAIIGIAPETVSRVIADFVRQGILTKVGNTVSTRHFTGDMGMLEKISQEV